jgi:hypothetical protein
MSCPICRSGNQMEFSSEMVVHLGGFKNVDKSGVMLFPKVLVCLDCGFSQFTVSKAERALLASESPNSERVRMAAAG